MSSHNINIESNGVANVSVAAQTSDHELPINSNNNNSSNNPTDLERRQNNLNGTSSSLLKTQATNGGLNCVYNVTLRNVQQNYYEQPTQGLENKINEILFCIICLELPNTAIYQCQLGHIMCEPCLIRVLAESRLRCEIAKCPGCRIDITFNQVSRNLAVERVAAELPSHCQYCAKKFPSKYLEYHMKNDCQERPIVCKYSRIGCTWHGYYREQAVHEALCEYASKTGAQIVYEMETITCKQSEEESMLSNLLTLLDCQRIIFSDIKLILQLNDDGRAFFETAPFFAFNQQWLLKALPDLSLEHPIKYQLILKTTPQVQPMSIQFLALKGPFSDLRVQTVIYGHNFTEEQPASPLQWFPLCFHESARLLSKSYSINMRLLMFWVNG